MAGPTLPGGSFRNGRKRPAEPLNVKTDGFWTLGNASSTIRRNVNCLPTDPNDASTSSRTRDQRPVSWQGSEESPTNVDGSVLGVSSDESVLGTEAASDASPSPVGSTTYCESETRTFDAAELDRINRELPTLDELEEADRIRKREIGVRNKCNHCGKTFGRLEGCDLDHRDATEHLLYYCVPCLKKPEVYCRGSVGGPEVVHKIIPRHAPLEHNITIPHDGASGNGEGSSN